MNDLTSVKGAEEYLASLTPEERERVQKEIGATTRALRWVPNPGPQMEAYYSKADILLYGGEPGGGKLLYIHTVVPTPGGWSTMEELKVGDQVFDEAGRPCRVIAKSDVEYEQTYRIVFSDGSEIIAGARHQWVTQTRRERGRTLKNTPEYRAARRASRVKRGTGEKPWLAELNAKNAKTKELPTSGVRTTQEIFDTLMAGTHVNHCVAVAQPMRLSERELPIDPYVLGVWLGDGHSDGGTITKPDDQLYEPIEKHYEVRRHKDPKNRGVIGLKADLRTAGVLGNKHIPAVYLRASFEQRLALLQGLMDTDGHADSRGQCEFYTVRKHLAEQARELILSLGIKCTIGEGIATLNGRDMGPKFRIKFITELPVFQLPRKAERQKREGFRGTHSVRYIEQVVPVDQVPMQCIQVDSPNCMYLVGETMIPTHNSQLILGLAFNCHKRSLVMRRQYTDIDALVESAINIKGDKDGYNGSPPPKFQISDDQTIRFGAATKIGDEQQWMGRPRDLLGLDEATQFNESQVRVLMGWVRHEDPKQRCRVVFATNPPMTSEGLWVIQMFAPWLDETFPNPAAPGELRWVVSDDDGDRWVDGPEPTMAIVGGVEKMVEPMSRTYIPSSVSDNPFYVASNYQRTLDALPGELRAILMGGFANSLQDHAYQVIPTAWVTAAMDRGKANPRPPVGVPMSTISVDPSGGGRDPMAVARRYDGWFEKVVIVEGKNIPKDSTGSFTAAQVIMNRRDEAVVVVDMGGGFGGGCWEALVSNGIKAIAYKGNMKTPRRTKDRQLAFLNIRSEAVWRFREALDPDQPGGSPVSLYPDPELKSDLCALHIVPDLKHIEIESKEKTCARIGRSTNKGDATIMAWFEGPKHLAPGEAWYRNRDHRQTPKVVMGRGNRR